MKTRYIIVSVMMLLTTVMGQAQIIIGGSVYGGGNAGETGGNTKVTVYAGDLNNVYGGARMANVNGNAFVNIDGEHASDYIIINKVYGGNDISGTISATNAAVPEELTQKTENKIDGTWDAFVRVSTKTETVEGKVQETDDAKKIYIGQLFGGGNGNYIYSSETNGNDVIHILKDAETGAEILRTQLDIHQPDLGKTYLELLGGSIVNVFGGGNMATVTEDAVIHLNNPSKVVNHIKVKDGKEDESGTDDLLTEARFIKMGINYKFTYPNSDAFQIGNLFGGNNKVDMAIQPRWNLLGGKVRNLYSGGNEGRMTCPQGLLLVIPENSTLTVDNVYGGCRKADVRPLDAAGKDVPNAQIQLADNPTGIPAGFSARTRILGGTINNVYGGNDISGNVYGGNTVAILTTIHGNVYGGGNGSYAYTDNPALKNELLWRDFYYNPKDILGLSGDTFTELQSAEALNKVRPNAEQVSLLLRGKEDKPVFVEGSVFVGGNSASLAELTDIPNRQAHVKIGSYVTIDSLYLGNNGANMVKYNKEVRNEDGLVQTEGVLRTFANTTIAGGSKFNSMNLKDANVFDKYMEGCAMKLLPSVVFDDVEGYVPYSSQFGSFYCGGNVGSILTNGLTEISFNEKAIIYEKFVGGCNRANVKATEFNAAYYGGLLGDPDSNGDKLKLNFSHLKIQPMRWKDPTDKLKGLEWNTVVYNATTQKFDNVPNVASTEGGQNIPSTADDIVRRLKGGNIYGGCYESGHVNGNVILNINETLMERDKLFDVTDEADILYENTEKGAYTITKRNTGVILSEQGMDVLGDALNVFGAGYGADSEIWGSTTINLNKGYVFQIFGGGEMGAVGRKKKNGEYDETGEYVYDEKYSTYINLNGAASLPGVARGAAGDSPDMAECEFIYGGAFEGAIAGNVHINLNNGRIFNSFAGSCNADILGHTETYVGKNGFPWIRDHIYGGNDLGGSILGTNSKDFSDRIRDEVKTMVAEARPVSSYMEYTQGRVRNILGGCFGDYDYEHDPAYAVGSGGRVASKPYLHNAFINIRPNNNANNLIERVFGAGEGFPGDRDGDKSQDHSYVLIDIPEGIDNFANTEIFGAGAYNGLGMRYPAADTFDGTVNINEASAVIDLMRGRVSAAYGGSYEEGVTRRTLVNVPEKSTIKINNIFGGAYGMHILPPCDVYEANVNYLSGDARVNGAIYGGNNNVRRTLYSKVNVSAPVLKENGYSGTIYGAGRGEYTWSEYTEVNLEEGANVWEVYGGGELGNVLNAESVQKYLQLYSAQPAEMVANEDSYWGNPDKWEGGTVGGTLKAAYKEEWLEAWKDAWSIGDYYDPTGEFKRYVGNQYTNLTNPLVTVADMDDRDLTDAQKARLYKRYNTNVLIKKGATVSNYAYGGGYGTDTNIMSGGVYGSTYIALLGGTVGKDIYAAGTTGSVNDLFGVGAYSDSNPTGFTATANAFIAGGTVRNVYGGGWKGDVGYTTMTVSADGKSATFDAANERPGETHVVIGIRPDQKQVPVDYGFYNGVPAVQRNAYGGGEGGAIYGTTNLTVNNGAIGYEYDGTTASPAGLPVGYKEKVEDETYKIDGVFVPNTRLKDSGNAFGGGYDVKSSVDFSNITMWGGVVRNSLVGGGEIATIGRGAIDASGPSNSIRTLRAIYKAGKTNITMYNGHVLRNIFGGGKGYNLFGYGQQGTLYMDGYVFGQTEVQVHGGEIGTSEGLAEGYGNVFGAGDIGYVYSPSINSAKTKQRIGTGSPGHVYYYNENGNLTEDCKVVVSPWLQVKDPAGITINGHHYNQYDYVETDDLNTLPKKNDSGVYAGGWEKLITGDAEGEEERGIYIHNAVFAGGNVTSNSDQTYANATTVYGNTTATLYDVYHRDFITVGTEHTGGLYGGGNLSVVDGYRELNITNYGTDYYGLKQIISIQEYRDLSNRERAYFQLEYRCKFDVTIGGVFYEKDKRLTEEEYLKLLSNDDIAQQVKDSFEPYGFCSIYAGRLLNTIQRADLCGVFGSRMVLQGAKDRVAEVGEDIDYTINRVGELSLNQQHSVRADDKADDAVHGNYFGIYSLVNCLGNLTSDVRFGNTYINGNGESEPGQTYYSHKSANPTSSDRNKGQSRNQVALASGVFLELTTENSTADHKEYGYVTGVIELDLINVKKDLVGGGFVYAKNEHRVPMYYPNKTNVILSEYNNPKTINGIELRDEARTYKRYRYSLDQEGDWSENEGATVISGDVTHVYETMVWQTSGNFIHPSKRIVDDCYPTNNAYIIGSANYSEAHYWYVKGEVYIYDQKVSAYTGSATAYSKEVHLPLTITAASNGKLQLLNVKPNLYAYRTDKDGTPVKIGTLGADGEPIDKVWVNNESDSYGLNDVISWWDWHQLSAADRQYFVTETFLNCVDCVIDGVAYEQGTYVMDQHDYDIFMAGAHDIRDANGDKFKDDDGLDIGKTFVFRSSNNISHETGYVLTFDMNSPKVWDDYYSPTTGDSSTGKIMKMEYEALFTDGMSDAQKQKIIDAWREGPTFTPSESGVYGKKSYKTGEIVTEGTYENAGEGQEKMEKAYVATESVTYTYNGITKTVNPGTAISKTEYEALKGTATYDSFSDAWFCTNSVKLTKSEYLLYGELKTAAEIAGMKSIEGKLATDEEIDAALTPAYICTQDGDYGGQRFETGTNYSAIQAWCSLPVADREKFSYNYDALDLLTDSEYLRVDPEVTEAPAPEATAETYHSPYTDLVDVEYQAVFKKADVDVQVDGRNLNDGEVITNKQFETIRNDKRHYTHVETKNNGDYVYIAKENFVYLGTPYGRGQVVDGDVYNANANEVEVVKFETAGEWYYCYEDHEAEDGSIVKKGTKLTKAEYGKVPNYQQYFIIQGQEPTETTTLYVSRESNAYDVLKEKIITVVYQYTYYEDEDDGSVKLTNELHVINVHLDLESGVPQIGQLSPPATVLPGNAVGLKAPEVNPGLYEVLTSGWELYSTQDDADNHRNGVPFENNNTPVYWYQNQKNYIAFYSKTYLGKTYSNSVPLSVANYHDIDQVMLDKVNHMYVDKSNVDRPCKIYIDNRECLSDPEKSELDLLKDFFDLSLQSQVATTGETAGHETLDSHVHAARNLEFFLNSDVSPKKYTTWTPIGNDDTTGDSGQCFEGNLHGDGYTISGLSNSLFGHLCGDVYNLGVTGSFTSAGVADSGDGYVENCWVKTSGTPAAGVKAVFGNPTSENAIQLVNSYYPESNAYSETNNAHGNARKMSDEAFHNGEVAFDLNGFYLYKRYNDHQSTPAVPKNPYVEGRFADGDFRYANGTIPETTDVRMRVETVGEDDEAVSTVYFDPIWPDDYIYFGQALTYGYVEGAEHQELPSHIQKNGDYILTEAGGNRVYRAPAYFGNSEMHVVHFNPYAVFAQTYKDDASVVAHKGMTAIDFTGHNDLSKGYKEGLQDGKYFYPPLLVDDGLSGFLNVNLTQNLLVYSPSQTDNEATHDVLDTYFVDLPCEEQEDDENTVDINESDYRRVAAVTAIDEDVVKGHVVFKAGNTYVADRDHYLVDLQDFNAPISYSFGNDYRMWYQRKPDNYVDDKKGWEAVSLPFSAELVTTQDKGEITHFYQGSETGHEYWLRQYKGGSLDRTDASTFIATMAKPEPGSVRKDYTNTFLWDYYYSKDNYLDKNADEYQKTYYSDTHFYGSYPYAAAGMPYIIGLPGERYHEFDLSGEWEPQNRYLDATIVSPGRQIVTFASEPGATVKVSDAEMKAADTYNGYTFRPNYQTVELPAETAYLLNADGSRFEKNATATMSLPFRPYFTASPNNTRTITFGNEQPELKAEEDHGDPRKGASGTLNIYTKKGRIFVESSLSYTTDVRVVSPSGITVAAFAVKSGETVTVQADFSGIYVTYTLDGRYIKKLSVDK